jgi:biopolymer transport protein TolQ
VLQESLLILNASRRAAALAHRDLNVGITSVASIAATAPFFGFFGTVIGIVNSFPGFGTDRLTILGVIAELLSDSLWPTVLGLAVGLMSLLIYQHLRSVLRRLDEEMEFVALDLVDRLTARGRPHQSNSHPALSYSTDRKPAKPVITYPH